jgi:nucleoside-diphosphate-sugar epimerase
LLKRSLRELLGRASPASEPGGNGRDRILVTGAAGTIGSLIVNALSDAYVVRGLDVERGSGVDWVADMKKLEQIEKAFRGMSAVVDLAADPRVSAPWSSILRNNLPATANALEAARRAGVRSFVFASSNHVVGMYERDEPYASVVAGSYEGLDPERLPRLKADVPIRPDSPYGIGKAFGEAAARYYSDTYGLQVICLRIGSVHASDRPLEPRQFATLLTHRDLAHLVRCCLSAPPALRFAVFYGVSRNTWRFWDIDDAREAIGYTPADDAEQWR